MALFQRGAVRLLDSLLSAPQQPVEEVLVQEEAIRSVTCFTAPANQQFYDQYETKVRIFLSRCQALTCIMRLHLPAMLYRLTTVIETLRH